MQLLTLEGRVCRSCSLWAQKQEWSGRWPLLFKACVSVPHQPGGPALAYFSEDDCKSGAQGRRAGFSGHLSLKTEPLCFSALCLEV